MYDQLLVQDLAADLVIDKKLEKRYKNAAKNTFNCSFPKQQNVLKDKYDRIAVRTARRSGKTRTAIHKIVTTHCENPGAWTAIVSLTQGLARRQYWKEMQDWAKREGIDLIFDKHLLEINWPCGGKTILIGADRTSEIDKLRGLKFYGVVLDEAKSYSPRILQELIEEVIEPALQDYAGWLLMIGTPGSILAGIFYQATCMEYTDDDGDKVSKLWGSTDEYWNTHEHVWSFHYWTNQDNPFLVDPETGVHRWELALRKKKRKKWADDHPVWVREYLGQWAASEDALIYPFSLLRNKTDEFGLPLVTWIPKRNIANEFGLPECTPDGITIPDESWNYLLGTDLGFVNPSGFVIAAYTKYLPNLYHCWDKKETELNVSQFAAIVHECRQMLPDIKFNVEVFDSSGSGALNIMKELNENFNCNFVKADKGRMNIRKMDYFHIVSDYMHLGRIKIIPGSGLAQEMELLQWDLTTGIKSILAEQGKLREHPECPNHLSDAFLYLFKWWYKQQIPKKDIKTSELTIKEREKQEINQLKQEKSIFLRLKNIPVRIIDKKSALIRYFPLVKKLKNEFLV